MDTQTEQFRFIGRAEADTVVGERVLIRYPVTPPASNAQGRVSLAEFLAYFYQLQRSLLVTYGVDCSDFELEFASDAISVIFTRPMDVVEQTQIRAHRARLAAGERHSDLTDEDRIARSSRQYQGYGELPDPAVTTLGPVST